MHIAERIPEPVFASRESSPVRSHGSKQQMTAIMDELLLSIDLQEKAKRESERERARNGEESRRTEVKGEIGRDRDGGEEESESPGDAPWHVKELQRRKKEEQDRLIREAQLGNMGVLEDAYLVTIPQYLAFAHSLSSRSVTYLSFPLVGSYSAQAVVAQLTTSFELIPDLVLNAFRRSPSGAEFLHYKPERDLSKVKRSVELPLPFEVVMVGRNPQQWEEARSPHLPDCRLTEVWVDPSTRQPLQLYQPLVSWKAVHGIKMPFLCTATARRNMFIPRQRLLFVKVTCEKVMEWSPVYYV